MLYKVNVVFTFDRGEYHVYCPDLPGCYSQGASFEEAKDNIRKVLDNYAATLTRQEIEFLLNKELYTTTMSLKVA